MVILYMCHYSCSLVATSVLCSCFVLYPGNHPFPFYDVHSLVTFLSSPPYFEYNKSTKTDFYPNFKILDKDISVSKIFLLYEKRPEVDLDWYVRIT